MIKTIVNKKDELYKIMNKTFDPKQLALEQAEAYRGYIYSKLSDLMAEIADVDENTDVEKFAEEYCFDSPSGDVGVKTTVLLILDMKTMQILLRR